MPTGSSNLENAIETIARLAGRIGFNEIRVRWKLIRATQRGEVLLHSLDQRVKHLLYPHKVCTECGAVLDRGAETCLRCGARASSRASQIPARLGVALPGLASPTSVLCAVIVAIYVRLGLKSGSAASLPVEVLYSYGGNFGPSVWAGEWWRLGSAIFLHANLPHILFNTVALAQVGRHVEELFGKVRMLAFFMLTGVFASFASSLWPRGVGIGASGAIMGLIGVTAGWGQRDGTTIGRNARDYMIRWGVSCMMLGFFIGADNVAHAAGFLSGGVLGFVIPPVWRTRTAISPALVFALLLAVGAAAASIYPTWVPLGAEMPWARESPTAVGPSVQFEVRDRGDQELEIVARGQAVPITPDVVELFASAVNLGMLAGDTYPPWESGARVLSKDVDASEPCETWRVELHHVDPGAFRVLHDLLAARNLSEVSIRTVEPPGAAQARWLALDALPYPGARATHSFDVDSHDDPSSVYITLSRRPDPDHAKALDAGLSTWLSLLWLGGYGGFGGVPDASSPPDDASIGVSFDELDCDPAAFQAIVNYAERVHHAGTLVQKVTIR